MKWDFKAGEVLLIDKAREWTSFDVVNKLKIAFKPTKIKIGHAGTLDPLATGLLIICTGKKTKEISHFQDMEKEYEGKFIIGKTTPSFDAETEIDGHYPIEHINEHLIEAARKSFIGFTEQLPPQFSAVKVKGRRAYEMAREGKPVELKKRPIEITSFDIDTSAFPEVSFRITCSKGTYIRSIARDLGEKLNSGAYMSALRRVRIGGFNVEEAVPVEEAVKLIKEHHEDIQ